MGELARKFEKEIPLQFLRSVRRPRLWIVVSQISVMFPGKHEFMTS
jgi:hypothetical protein